MRAGIQGEPHGSGPLVLVAGGLHVAKHAAQATFFPVNIVGRAMRLIGRCPAGLVLFECQQLRLPRHPLKGHIGRHRLRSVRC